MFIYRARVFDTPTDPFSGEACALSQTSHSSSMTD